MGGEESVFFNLNIEHLIEREREREREMERREDDLGGSEARISSTTSEFIFSRKDCVYEIVIDIFSWQVN